MTTVLKRVGRALLGWTLVFAVVGLAVHPERCDPPTRSQVRRAAVAAVGWFAANLDDDGRFVYRYDRDEAARQPGYNDVRHAGVLLSLYQAASAGIPGAADVAEQGLKRVDRVLDETTIGTAYGAGRIVMSGASALLVAALAERRAATGATDRDDLLIALGRTLEGVVGDDGAVAASIDRDEGPLDDRSPFFTGEVLWALSRLHVVFPDAGFGESAQRVRRYLVEDRDRVESPWPPVSDHWAAYAFETMSRWPDSPTLGAIEIEWLDRQLALFGLQTRYESQRRGGVTVLTRGHPALGAGVGTLGEGLANHLTFIERTPGAFADTADLVSRAGCVASLLVDRQVTAEEALGHRSPKRVTGAWFHLGVTQMDDQQHALSALLLLEGWLPR